MYVKYKKGNKYSSVCQTYNGHSYHSRKEANYAYILDIRKKAGEIKEIVPQFKLEIYVKGKKICNYYVDFKVVLPDGLVEFHEVKGFETDLWRLKWKLAQALLEEIAPNSKLVLIK